MRRAAARGRDRPRTDSVDRVPARSRGPVRASCPTWRSPRAARSRRSPSTRTTADADVRSIAMDTSSRTSVALVARAVRSACSRSRRALEHEAPDLDDDAGGMRRGADHRRQRALRCAIRADRHDREDRPGRGRGRASTGLPFVYAFWAGRHGARRRRRRRRRCSRRAIAGVAHTGRDRARRTSPTRPSGRPSAARYLRDNIKYSSGRRGARGARAVLSVRRRGRRRAELAVRVCGVEGSARRRAT